MKVNIGIDTKTFIRFWLVVIGFGLAGLLVYRARHGLLIILVALFIAVALGPIVNRIARKMPKKNRTMSAAITYVLVVGVLGTIIALIAPPVTRQVIHFVDNMPDVISQAVDSWGGFNDIIERNGWMQYRDQAMLSLQSFSADIARNIGSSVITGAGAFMRLFTTALLTLVMAFMMMVQGPKFMRSVWAYFDKFEKTKQIERVVNKMTSTVSRYVLGQVTVAAIDGVVTSIVMFVLSFIFDFPVDMVVPIAMIVAVMSLIPMFGATIGAIIAAILLSFSDFGAAIAFVIYFVIYQQIENNLVSPIVQSKSSQLPALVVLMSVLVGVYMFGLLGGIIAIPIAGCTKILLDEFRNAKHTASKNSPDNSDAKKLETKLA